MNKIMLTLTGAAALAAMSMPTGAEEPWAERVIVEHVDQGKLTGTLDTETLKALRDTGEHLFTGRFTEADGVGRPLATQAIIPTKRKREPVSRFFRSFGMDGSSCVVCHNQPVTGAAGDFVANAFISEGFESADFDSLDPQFSNERGSVHLMRRRSTRARGARPGSVPCGA